MEDQMRNKDQNNQNGDEFADRSIAIANKDLLPSMSQPLYEQTWAAFIDF
jgi:hypothetical protein